MPRVSKAQKNAGNKGCRKPSSAMQPVASRIALVDFFVSVSVGRCVLLRILLVPVEASWRYWDTRWHVALHMRMEEYCGCAFFRRATYSLSRNAYAIGVKIMIGNSLTEGAALACLALSDERFSESVFPSKRHFRKKYAFSDEDAAQQHAIV